MREDPVQTFDFSNSAKSSPLPLVLPPNENHGRERLHRDRQQSARIRLQLYLFQELALRRSRLEQWVATGGSRSLWWPDN